MLNTLRQKIIATFWQQYLQTTPHMQVLASALPHATLPLDHLAMIDLPGPHTGISVMQQLFTMLGFVTRGKGYLPDKQNDFLWLAEEGCETLPAADVLPQLVVADFRPEEMPDHIADIIRRYASQASPFDMVQAEKQLARMMQGDENAFTVSHQQITRYFSGRDWPLPTVSEFQAVHAFNELLAWVLVFGRRPNHFTVSVHLLDGFANLGAFHEKIQALGLTLNSEGGVIKGSRTSGLEQGSTMGETKRIALKDGEVFLPHGFIEFIWRHPQKTPATCWGDYFTGFIAAHANHVIESLY